MDDLLFAKRPYRAKLTCVLYFNYTADVKTVKFCASLLIYVLLEEDSNVHSLIIILILIVMSCE